MKYHIIIILFAAFVSCKTQKGNEFFEIQLTEKTVVGISPDSIEISKMKKELGEEDFYVLADDVLWYRGKMLEVLDSLRIKFIDTDKRLIKIITPNDQIEINTDTSVVKWRYFFYDGEKTLERDVFELMDSDDLR
ncbi:MAG: hypothetical protein CMH48_13725 [Muricauda sp.]|nr:hypothetical protein [Allomuricauda sp.]MBC31888.1 hypothetical protein [Allomuricauda sp.]|tara:strand:- start:1561 stop:1965 length:405 start_codon:yes stop_codon:yes gene_type:complete